MGRPRKVKPVVLASDDFKLVESPFEVRLQIGNEVYESSGATMIEALNGLNMPNKFFLKGILDIRHGDKHKNMLLTPMRAKRLFMNSPSMKAVVAKQLTTLIS